MVDVKVEDSVQDGDMKILGAAMETDTSAKAWNEEQLERCLQTLKEMYIQLRDLRSTIPRLVAPLAVQQPSPEKLFRDFKSAATTANDDLKKFRRLVEAGDSQKIFDHVKESRAENPKGIMSWRVTDHPDWYVRDT